MMMAANYKLVKNVLGCNTDALPIVLCLSGTMVLLCLIEYYFLIPPSHLLLLFLLLVPTTHTQTRCLF